MYICYIINIVYMYISYIKYQKIILKNSSSIFPEHPPLGQSTLVFEIQLQVGRDAQTPSTLHLGDISKPRNEDSPLVPLSIGELKG